MRKIARGLSACTLAGLAAPLWAADNSSPNQTSVPLEEVVVTAQRREERLQDVPLAISVLGGEELDKFTGRGVMDALITTPGVTANEGGGGITSGGTRMLSVRGVSASSVFLAGSSPAAYYVDSMPFGLIRSAFLPDTNAYDLERVEVLKGPQGTLYGANALAGVVRILTHEVDLNEFELKTRVSAASVKEGDESYGGDVAVNVPIVPGQLGARLVLGYKDGGGWIDDLVSDDINGQDVKNMRLKIKAQPNDRLSLGLTGLVSRGDYGSLTTADADYNYPGNGLGGGIVDYDIVGLDVGYEFSTFAVTSSTTSTSFESDTKRDFSFIDPTNATGLFWTPFTNRVEEEILTEELLFKSTGEGVWRWSGGLFYRDAKERLIQGPTFGIDVDEHAKSQQTAVFGEVTRTFLAGKLRLTGGLRYFEDDVSYRATSVDPDAPAGTPYEFATTYQKTSPRVVLAWHPSQDSMLYASYAQGYRSGQPQTEFIGFFLPGLAPAKPDTFRNYELGTKGSLLQGRLSYEAAIYYNDWQDPQQFVIVNSLWAAIVNGISASGVGYELGLTFRPLKTLEFSVAYAANDLTQDEEVLGSGGLVLIEKGARMNVSPEYTINASAGYSTALGASGLDARFSVSGSYAAPVQARTLDQGVAAFTSVGDPMRNLRAEVGVGAADRWELAFFVDNATDDRSIELIPSGADRDSDFNTARRRPRTIGVQFEYRY